MRTPHTTKISLSTSFDSLGNAQHSVRRIQAADSSSGAPAGVAATFPLKSKAVT